MSRPLRVDQSRTLVLAAIGAAALLMGPGTVAQQHTFEFGNGGAGMLLSGAALPPAFIANAGQWPAEVQFAARFPDLDAFFETTAVTLRMKARLDETTRGQAVVKLRFESACADGVVVGVGASSAKYNFLLGPNAESYHVDVPCYDAVRYRGLQPGIDIEFVVRNGHLAFDVHLAGDAEASSLIVACDGVSELRPGANGLLLDTALGVLTLSPPIAWEQRPASGRRDLACTIRKLDERRFSYELAERNPGSPAVIDPGITWATYLGGLQNDSPQFLMSAGDGSVLVGGVTYSLDFPTTSSAFDTLLNEGTGVIADVFIARLDSTGSTLVAATFLGGAMGDFPGDFALDARGRVVVVGRTSSDDFPLTANAYNSDFSAEGSDGFISILDPTLSQVEYSSCMGAPALQDTGAGKVAISPTGSLICLGGTFTGQAVATSGAYDTTFNGVADLVIFELDPWLPPASQLVFLTYLGGSDLEWGEGHLKLALDGTIIVAGNTSSTDFPVTPGAFDTDFGGGFNSFIAALSPDGTSLEWATFVKSTGVYDLVVDGDGAVTACFTTSGSISPVSPSAFDSTPNGLTDGLVCRFDPTGSQLLWGTYLGSQGQDYLHGLDVDASGAVMVCGRTNSPNFPVTAGAHDTTFSGACSDAIVAYLSNDGSQLLYASYLGSGSSMCMEANVVLALDVGVALVAGDAPAGFPVTPGAFDTTYGGGGFGGDGFVVKMPLYTPWTDLGQGLAGSLGVPKLLGTGWLGAGDPTKLALTRAKPGSTAALIVGFSELSAPFKGGVLVPFPDIILAGLPVSAGGTLTLTAAWPAGVPADLTLYFQEWIVDPAAVAGLSASNAIAATTP